MHDSILAVIKCSYRQALGSKCSREQNKGTTEGLRVSKTLRSCLSTCLGHSSSPTKEFLTVPIAHWPVVLVYCTGHGMHPRPPRISYVGSTLMLVPYLAEETAGSENRDTISSSRTLNIASHRNRFVAEVSTVCFITAAIRLCKRQTWRSLIAYLQCLHSYLKSYCTWWHCHQQLVNSEKWLLVIQHHMQLSNMRQESSIYFIGNL